MRITGVYETGTARTCAIYPFNNSRARVEIMQSKDLAEGWERTKINWPGIGSEPSDVAEEFVAGMLEAIKIAKQWDDEKGAR